MRIVPIDIECKIFIFSPQITPQAIFFDEFHVINSKLSGLTTKFISFPKSTYSSGSNFCFALSPLHKWKIM